jgi:hypothetical protein
MAINGVVRHVGYEDLMARRRERLLARPVRDLNLDGDLDMDSDAELHRPARRCPEGMVLGRTVGVAGAAFLVGVAQGRFGTSKVNGVPAELVAGGLLHATAACANVPEPAREAMRALGDGALAAAALTFGYQVGLGRR